MQNLHRVRAKVKPARSLEGASLFHRSPLCYYSQTGPESAFGRKAANYAQGRSQIQFMAFIINYQEKLNPAQYEAATTLEGPVLVVAGAGSGKTRTIVYRLARLMEEGVPPQQILLLTFTRKAAQEMTRRAEQLLGLGGSGVSGGTFHGFAYSVLRRFPPPGYRSGLTVMDTPDSLSALRSCKEDLKIGKGERAFPKTQTILSLISKSRNKEVDLDGLIRREAAHLMPYAPDMAAMADAYAAYKLKHSVLDYDDLLFALENQLRGNPELLALERGRFSHIMVDEYQDTNPVQARLTQLLAGENGNVMVVGDDAQSIYAFRGADVRNILNFPRLFPEAKLIKLEENYRSTQPVLDLTNAILAGARESFHKHLHSSRQSAVLPRLIRPLHDLSQAALAASMVSEFLHTYPAREIAVLFRAGYQSFNLEVQLNKQGIHFKKYGGLRYTDAAHIKDVMAMARLIVNPLDFPAFARVGEFYPGIGPKTAQRVYAAAVSGDAAQLDKAAGRHKDFLATLRFLDELRAAGEKPAACLSRILDHYRPVLEANYADDYPYRQQGLDEFLIIAEPYADLDLLISDLCLEDPGPEAGKGDDDGAITLSTVHSAKGLEWSVVLIIDLVQDRFPSRHALLNDDEYEEERRLLYVACTRAKDELILFAPVSVYNRGLGAHEAAVLSPFVHELPEGVYIEEREGYGGALYAAPARFGRMARPEAGNREDETGGQDAAFKAARPAPPRLSSFPPWAAVEDLPEQGESAFKAENVISGPSKDGPLRLGYCRHRLFGRGKIVQHIPPDKYRVNFTGFGLKVIMADYLVLEED